MAPSNPPPTPGIGHDPPPAAAVLAYFRDRIADAPDDEALWSRYGWTLGSARGIEEIPVAAADEALARALTHPAVHPEALVPAIRAHLRRLPVLGPWLREADRLAGPPVLPGSVAEAAASNPLVRTVLGEVLLPDAGFDRLLGALRRHLLLEPTPSLTGATALAVDVARACHRGGYVHAVGNDEGGEVDRWADAGRLEDLTGGPEAEARLAILASYRSLNRWPWAAELEDRIDHGEAPALGPLVDQQLRRPRREAELARTIPRLGSTVGADHPVRAFYEAHPYPRWSRLGYREPLGLPERIEVELLGRRPTGLPDPGRPEVLVAGCGTGLHPLAVRAGLRDASVIAIDVSLASLGYAARKAEELKLTDVHFLQADLLECAGWERDFDVVESIGVLHHLKDPAAGLQALVGWLRPGGLLKLGLYSRRGRGPVNRVRGLLSERGLIPSDGIVDAIRARAAREALLPLLREDPALGPLLERRDLYTLSGVRDLLLHPLETSFDLDGIGALLRSHRLTFLGFAELPRSTLADFRTRFPGPDAETDLVAWDAFEADRPETFLGMYRFWCQAPGSPG